MNTAWAVYDPKGALLYQTIRQQKRRCLFAACTKWNWDHMKKLGYTIREIVITPIPEDRTAEVPS